MVCTASAIASRMKVCHATALLRLLSCMLVLPQRGSQEQKMLKTVLSGLAAAIRFLGIAPQAIGNLKFLAANPEIANFETGADQALASPMRTCKGPVRAAHATHLYTKSIVTGLVLTLTPASCQSTHSTVAWTPKRFCHGMCHEQATSTS